MNNFKNTYCNPIKIEDYPKAYTNNPSHRSLADPSVLYHGGKWYMYPSYEMAYVSEDFVTWRHHRIQPNDTGWAPTVAEHRGMIYLYGRDNNLYRADNPLGPFENLGNIKFDDGTVLKAHCDPMIFCDDDGRVYVYYTQVDQIGPNKYKDIYISVCELDSDNLNRAIGHEVRLIGFEPTHTWEWSGTRNENTSVAWIEGVWVIKRNGRYYLIYSGAGTQYPSYAMGACYSDVGPMEGFVYQKHNPICNKPYGLSVGGGHGCITEGPNNTLWAFYTITMCCAHMFERRIGMDPVTFDENGEIMVLKNTDTPQWAPGIKNDPYHENNTGLLPLTYYNRPTASSSAPGRDPIYAVDESLLSWWQPQKDDPEKTLTVPLRSEYMVSAMRIIWRDVGLDYDNGVSHGPFKYRVELSEDGVNWKTAVDKSNNTTDYLIDYETFETMRATHARLVICGTPDGIEAGVISFTVFGVHE